MGFIYFVKFSKIYNSFFKIKLNLTNLVKSLQEKLKKEIYLRHELNNKLKKSEKEVSHLKTYISKLEKEFKGLTRTSLDFLKFNYIFHYFSKVSSPTEVHMTKIYENKIKSDLKTQQNFKKMAEDFNKENQKKILELSVLNKL